MDADYLSGSPGIVQNIFSDYALDADRVWCTMDGKTYTYREMDESANRLAHALVEHVGIGKGDIVAVYMATSIEYFLSMFAIHRIGAVYLPCSTNYAEDELAYQFGHAEVRAVISDAEYCERARASIAVADGLSCPLIVCGNDEIDGALMFNQLVSGQSSSPLEEQLAVTLDDLAMMIYTSGTTARPKGVMLSHGNLTTEAHTMAKHLGWRHDDRFLHYFPLYHGMGGIAGLAPAIIAGASLAIVPKFSASTFSQMLVEEGATFASLNATHANVILRSPETEFDAVHGARRMMLGTSIGPKEWEAFEKRFNTRLMGVFGLTETLGINVVGEAQGPRRIGSAGRVVRGYTLRTVNDDGEPTAVNEPGEALFQTHQRHGLAMGYYKDPEKTKETFGEWLMTGDVLRIDEDGFVWFVGRKKDMIKRSGFNVAAAEVERVILEIPGVVDVAVVGTPDAIREEAIVAFVVPESPGAVSEDAVFERCAAYLSDYKRPQFVEFIDALPVSFIGKVERKMLREIALKYRIDSMERKPIDFRGQSS